MDALRSRGPTGPDPSCRPPKVEQALLQGAQANGFATDLWTLERVAVVITQLTGVRYHPGHVWLLLRRRLGWSLQRPERQARNATRRRLPAGSPMSGRGSKRGRRKIGLDRLLRRIGHLADPTGPATWSPRGHTPILRHRFAWKRASMAAALGYRPDGTAARLCFHLQQPSYNTDTLIGVLDQLGLFYAGQRWC